MVKKYGREIGEKIGTVTKEKNGNTITSNIYKDSEGRRTYVLEKKERTKTVKKQKETISKIQSGSEISKSEYRELVKAGILKETDEGTVLTRSASTVGVTMVEQDRTPTNSVLGFTGKNLRDYEGKYKVQTTTPGRYSGDAPKSVVQELSRSEFMKQYPKQYQEIQRTGSKQSVSGTFSNTRDIIGIGAFGEKLTVSQQKDDLSGRSISYDDQIYKIQTEKKISRKLNNKQRLDVEFDPVTQAGTVESIRSVKDTPKRMPVNRISALSDDVEFGLFGWKGSIKRRSYQEGWLKPGAEVTSSFSDTLLFQNTDDINRRLRLGSPYEAIGTLGAFGLQVATAGKAGTLIKGAISYGVGTSSMSAAALAVANTAGTIASVGSAGIVIGAATPHLAWSGVKQFKGDEFKQMDSDVVLTSAYKQGISKSTQTGQNLTEYKQSLISSNFDNNEYFNTALDKSIFFTGSKLGKYPKIQAGFFHTNKFIDQFSKDLLLGRGDKQTFLDAAQSGVSAKLTQKELDFLSTKRETMKWAEPAAIVLSGMGTELVGRATIPMALSKAGNIAAKSTWLKVASTSALKIAPLGFAEGVAVTISGSTARGQKVTSGQLIQAGLMGAGSAAVIGGVIGGMQFAKTTKGRVFGKGTATFSYLSDPGEYFGDKAADIFMGLTKLKEQKGVLTGVSRKLAGKKTSYILTNQKYRSLTFVPTSTKTQTRITTKINTQIPTLKNTLGVNLFSNVPTSIKTSNNMNIKTSPMTQSNIFTNLFTNTNVPSNVPSNIPSNVNANIFTNIPVSTQVPVSTNVPVTVRTNVFIPHLDIPFIPPGAGFGGGRQKRGKRTKKGYETKFISSVKKFVTTGKVTVKKTKLYK